jgi:hypothetical protein
MVNKFHFIIFLFLIPGELFSFEKNFDGDTVTFSSENVGLCVWTHNIDSIKYYQEKNKQINPFSPSMYTFSANVYTYDTATLVINVKDKDQNTIVTFIWNSISPGAYRFDWWQYTNNLPSSTYYIEKTINNNSETHKALLVK